MRISPITSIILCKRNTAVRIPPHVFLAADARPQEGPREVRVEAADGGVERRGAVGRRPVHDAADGLSAGRKLLNGQLIFISSTIYIKYK